MLDLAYGMMIDDYSSGRETARLAVGEWLDTPLDPVAADEYARDRWAERNAAASVHLLDDAPIDPAMLDEHGRIREDA